MNEPGRALSAAGGYLLDIYQLARARAIHPHSYLKYLTLRALAKRTGARLLVETGTFRGVTSARCAGCFERVITIELDVALARQAKQRLASYRNVTVLQGDAVDLLPSVISEPSCSDALVFLDGHFSGAGTARGAIAEPALLELEILAEHANKLCGIVVDDFRLFGVEDGFPKKSELIAAIEKFFPAADFSTCVHLDQLIVERRALPR